MKRHTPAGLTITLGTALLLAACGGSTAPPPSSAPAAPSSAAAKPASTAPASGTAASAAPSAATSSSAAAKPAGSAAPSGSTAAKPAASGSAQLQSIKISNPAPTVSILPFWAGIAQGFFKAEGLDVTMVQMAPPTEVAAAAKGDIDMIDTPSDVVAGATNGLPLKIVYEAWDKSPWVIIGKTNATSTAELKGKTIAIHAAGTAPYAFLEAALKDANLTVKDVQLLHQGNTQDIFTAVVNAKADAGVVSPPFDIQAADQGVRQVAFIGDKLQIPYIGLAVTPKYLEQHRTAVVGVIRGLWKATAWIKANPDGSAQIIVKNTGAPLNIAQAAYKEMVPLLTTSGKTPRSGIDQTIAMQEGVTGKKITNVKYEDVVDDGPLNEALKA